ERVDEQPHRRDQPHDHDDGEGQVQDDPSDARPATGGAGHGTGPGGSLGGLQLRRVHRCDGHRMASCSRNRRMLKIMIGMMARNSTTAIALARPKWPKLNISLYIRLASTSEL